jgi:hypothetical protein
MRLPLVIFLFVSINSFAQIKEFSWLVGTWQGTSKKHQFEEWKLDGNSLSGESYTIEKGSKKVAETIKIIKKGDDFYYVPDVEGAQGPIEFKVTSINEYGFVAENPNHDFPKVISYQGIDPTQMLAKIGDSKKTIEYLFDKIK